MAKKSPRRVLADSARASVPREKPIGKVDPTERFEITIMVRPKPSAAADTGHAAVMRMGAQLPAERPYLTREAFAEQQGADPADFQKIEAFAHDHHLTVTMTSIPQRLMKLTGTTADLVSAFNATVKRYRLGKNTFRGRTGSLSVPTELADLIVGIYGFDTRPAAMPHHRILDVSSARKAAARPRAAGSPPAPSPRPFTALEIAKLYNFPTGLDGSGQCIALIELNTPNDRNQLGTGYTTADLKAYFKRLKVPLPAVSAVGISGGANLPNINLDADGEVMLDIEVAGAIAPGAQIAVYFAPNTGKGFIDVVSAAVHDSVRKPSVVSISWGGPEDAPFTTAQLRKGLSQVIQDAAVLGVTVCCASGDNGSSDLPLTDQDGNRVRDKRPHVDFPSSSPFALACGGTRLIGAGTTITSEQVWNDGDPRPHQASGSSGGGVSNLFDKPTYQATVAIPKSPARTAGRGVPDVAANADPLTGYLCKLATRTTLVPIGGTSAVAPLWAGLIARVNQRLTGLGKKTAGFINPILYNAPGAFHDVTDGNNDIDGRLKKYAAGTGWDACAGLGSPDGTKILHALGG